MAYSLRTRDINTCTQAAQHGDLKRLKWARANGCPWDEHTYTMARIHGHSEVLAWLEENGCPKPLKNGTIFYKIIGNNFGNYPYRLGLNTLKHNGEEFDPRPECCPGGLYFCGIDEILYYLYYGHTICLVTIPPDAQTVPVEKKIKADKIFIERMMSLNDVYTWKYLVEQGLDIHSHDNIAFEWAQSKSWRPNFEVL